MNVTQKRFSGTIRGGDSSRGAANEQHQEKQVSDVPHSGINVPQL